MNALHGAVGVKSILCLEGNVARNVAVRTHPLAKGYLEHSWNIHMELNKCLSSRQCGSPAPQFIQEEFEAVMLPRHGAQRGLVQRDAGDRRRPSGEVPYERLAPKGRIPTAVDWRGTGADGVVKDQVCWLQNG